MVDRAESGHAPQSESLYASNPDSGGVIRAVLDAKIKRAGNVPADADNGGPMLGVRAGGVATEDANCVQASRC